MRIFPVVMAGGSGTRFWPLSRKNRPKQFLALAGDEPLLAATISRLPTESGLAEAESLAAAIGAAADHGTAVTQALRAQARALRERRRLELVEAAERAQVRMLLPVGLLILPAFFVIVLYPAAVQLLRLTGP